MRTLFHIPIALILGFLAAVLLTFYLITETTLVHKVMHWALARYIESRYDVHIEFEDLGGSILRDVTIANVRVDTKMPDQSYRIVRIDKIEGWYDARRLWRGEWVIDSVVITAPLVVLQSDSLNRPLLPRIGRQTADAKETKPLPDVTVGRLRVEGGRFQWQRRPKTILIDSLFLNCAGSLQDQVLTVKVDSLALQYPQRGFHLRSLKAGLALANGQLGVDSLQIITDSSVIVAGGLYPLADSLQFRVQLRDSHVSLTELGALLGIGVRGWFDFDAKLTGRPALFSGTADARGVLYERELGPFRSNLTFDRGILSLTEFDGQMFGGTMRGGLEINFESRPETFGANLEVRGFDLNKVVPNTFPSRMNGSVELSGSGLGANSFNMDLFIDAGPGRFDWVRYDSLVGEISLNVEDIYFQPDFTLWYEHSRFSAEGVVRYDGEMQLRGDFATTQLQDFWGDLFIEELSGGAYSTYEVDGPVLDPNIRGRFYGDSCSFYGFSTDSLVADFDILSFLYGQRGTVDLHAWTSDVWNLPADSVQAAIDLDSNFVTINSATVFHDRYQMDGRATATIVDSTAFVKVSDFVFRFDTLSYTNAQPAALDFLADRIEVRDLIMAGREGRIALDCIYGFDTTINLHVITESFDFNSWLVDLGYDSLVSGELQADVRMTGHLKNPVIIATGGVNNLVYGADSLGNLATELRFADSLLRFAEFELKYRGFDVTASGEYPLVMNLDSGIVYVPENPLQINLKSQGTDLGIVASFNEDIESLTGDFAVDLNIYGTPQQPQTKGLFTLKNGRVKVYQMANPIEEINAQISSNGRQVIIEWAEGVVRHKKRSLVGSSWRSGTVRAAGEVNIINRDIWDYQLTAVGFDVPFQYDLGEIYGRADFELSVRGATPPLIEGEVSVMEAEYLDEFDDERTIEAIEAADTLALWDYSINMDFLPASVRVRNSDVNMVLDGQLLVRRQNAFDNYFGRLNIVRGSYYLADLNFKILEDSYLQFDNIEEPDPQLFINVTTQLRNASAELGGSGLTDVQAQIRGTLSRPEFGAAQGSQYSNEDLLLLLIANQTASGTGSAGFGSDFQQRALGVFTTAAGQAFQRQVGLEEFRIEPVYSKDGKDPSAAVSFGLYTLPNVYTYVSSLGINDGRADYGAEYRLGRHIALGGQYDRDRLWRLSLLLNWEFK